MDLKELFLELVTIAIFVGLLWLYLEWRARRR